MGRSRIFDHHLAVLTCFPKGLWNGTKILLTMVPPPIVCIFIDMAISSLFPKSPGCTGAWSPSPYFIATQHLIPPYLPAALSKTPSDFLCTDLCRSCRALHLPDFTLCALQASTSSVNFPSGWELGFLSEQPHFPAFMHTCTSLIKSMNFH